MPGRKKSSGNKLSEYLPYVVLIALVALYIATSNVVVGVAAFVAIIAVIALELRSSIKSEGLGKTGYEIGIAVGVVVLAFVLSSFILQVSFPPVSVVASCSMLPTLHRGDAVVLHGIPNMSAFLSKNHIPVVNVSEQAMESMLGNMNSEFLEFYAHAPSNASQIYQSVSSDNLSEYQVSLYNSHCLSVYSFMDQPYNYYRCVVDSQQGNLIRYNYSLAPITIANKSGYVVDTSQITIGNVTVSQDYHNPIIVYRTVANDSFSGEIVHRVFAAISSGSSYYLLTKGDNNPVLDIQAQNYPIAADDVRGYVLSDIPYIGYVRLILFGQVSSVAGCNQQITR